MVFLNPKGFKLLNNSDLSYSYIESNKVIISKDSSILNSSATLFVKFINVDDKCDYIDIVNLYGGRIYSTNLIELGKRHCVVGVYESENDVKFCDREFPFSQEFGYDNRIKCNQVYIKRTDSFYTRKHYYPLFYSISNTDLELDFSNNPRKSTMFTQQIQDYRMQEKYIRIPEKGSYEFIISYGFVIFSNAKHFLNNGKQLEISRYQSCTKFNISRNPDSNYSHEFLHMVYIPKVFYTQVAFAFNEFNEKLSIDYFEMTKDHSLTLLIFVNAIGSDIIDSTKNEYRVAYKNDGCTIEGSTYHDCTCLILELISRQYYASDYGFSIINTKRSNEELKDEYERKVDNTIVKIESDIYNNFVDNKSFVLQEGKYNLRITNEPRL